MKKKYLVPALAVPALALTLFGANAVSAHGLWGKNISPEEVAAHHQTMFENQANLLGVEVSEVKAAWAEGKNMKELALEKGISEADLKAKMQAQMKKQHEERLQALVSAGVITQAQADQRLKFMEEKKSQMKEKGPRGMGMGHRFGAKMMDQNIQ